MLSTLHTNDSVGAIGRLEDLEVPPFLLASSLLGVMAQRLMRKICLSCAEPHELSDDQLAYLKVPLPQLPGGTQVMKGAGCVKCRNTGYLGRTAVFEIFHVSPRVKELIARKAGTEALIEGARATGLKTLREAAVLKMAMGITTYEEVLRMTSSI